MTTMPTQTIKVRLPTHEYPIHIGAGLLAGAADYIAPLLPRPKVAIITDSHIEKQHLPTLLAAFEKAGIKAHCFAVPVGEDSKSFAALQSVCDCLLEWQIERDDMIIALGGGVVGDLTGFAAAILRRGARFMQIPTSLLAQVDSSIGGKTGINVKQGKNLIGAFHQPDLVLIDTDTLNTLSDRHMRAGFAEIVKYGALGAVAQKAPFLDWLEKNGAAVLARETPALTFAITESCRAKAAFVEADEREAGNRALLNLGHTFAHALENLTGYSQALFHGEAVAIGMCMAFDFSHHLGLCSSGEATRLRTILHGAKLPTHIRDITRHITNAAPTPAAMLAAMQQDKKVKGGKLRLILTRGAGDCFIASDIDEAALKAFLAKQYD